MICIYCDNPILDTDELFWLGFEVPYVNIKTHRSCWKKYKNTNFILENKDKILEYIKNMSKNSKK